jgi:GNAT superfamily N-acetyltransferase
MPETPESERSEPTLSVLHDAESRRAFAAMTYPTFRAALLKADGSHVAVGAWRDGQPVGLLLAKIEKVEKGGASILSVFVDPEHRRAGIGAGLFALAEAELRGRGLSRISIIYPTGSAGGEAVTRILHAQGWAEPRPRMHLILVDITTLAKVREAKWFRRPQLPEGCEMFPWAELTADERADMLRRQAESPWYPEELSPFVDTDPIDPRISLGLRYRGEIAGWCVAHRLADGTVRYTTLYMRPDVPKGAGFGLLMQASWRHIEGLGDDARASFGMKAGNPIFEFFQRRIRPFVDVESVRTTMESRKELGNDEARMTNSE